MHAKVTVADDVIFTGSFNLSRAGEKNAENVLEFEDAALANRLARRVHRRRPRALPVVHVRGRSRASWLRLRLLVTAVPPEAIQVQLEVEDLDGEEHEADDEQQEPERVVDRVRRLDPPTCSACCT